MAIQQKRTAQECERGKFVRTMRFCFEQGQLLAGHPYNDDLASSKGIHLELLVSPATSRELIDQAIREGYAQRDVVAHSVVVCPITWFQEAREQ